MPNMYTRLHIQFAFGVKFREALIQSDWKDEFEKYITGIFQKNKHQMLQINSMPDHNHIFAGMRPDQSISSIIQNVKTESSIWIKSKKFTKRPPAWQEGYGAFSYSKSHVSNQGRYKKENLLNEYRRFLSVFEIEWDERYILKGWCNRKNVHTEQDYNLLSPILFRRNILLVEKYFQMIISVRRNIFCKSWHVIQKLA